MAPPEKQRVLRFGSGDLIIDPKSRHVLARGEPIDLTTTEFRLLVFMVERGIGYRFAVA